MQGVSEAEILWASMRDSGLQAILTSQRYRKSKTWQKLVKIPALPFPFQIESRMSRCKSKVESTPTCVRGVVDLDQPAAKHQAPHATSQEVEASHFRRHLSTDRAFHRAMALLLGHVFSPSSHLLRLIRWITIVPNHTLASPLECISLQGVSVVGSDAKSLPSHVQVT